MGIVDFTVYIGISFDWWQAACVRQNNSRLLFKVKAQKIQPFSHYKYVNKSWLSVQIFIGMSMATSVKIPHFPFLHFGP